MTALVDNGSGQCAVTGDLTLDAAGNLWRELRASGLLRSATGVDLSQVGDSDSAGLALLVAWRASCRANGGDLKISALPGRLLALARITDAEALVSG